MSTFHACSIAHENFAFIWFSFPASTNPNFFKFVAFSCKNLSQFKRPKRKSNNNSWKWGVYRVCSTFFSGSADIPINYVLRDVVARGGQRFRNASERPCYLPSTNFSPTIQLAIFFFFFNRDSFSTVRIRKKILRKKKNTRTLFCSRTKCWYFWL